MQPSLVSLAQEVVVPLAINAAKGLMRAISLGTRQHSSSVAQDMLCKLSAPYFILCFYVLSYPFTTYYCILPIFLIELIILSSFDVSTFE